MAAMVAHHNAPTRDNFEEFKHEVQSGQKRLTTDDWLRGMQIQKSEIDDQRQSKVELGRALQLIGVLAALGVVLQIIALVQIRKAPRERLHPKPGEASAPDSSPPPEETQPNPRL